MRKKQKASQFLQPISLKVTPAKKKERRKARRKKGARRREKKAMVELLVFILATLEIVFGRKTADAIGGALFSNSVRYIFKTLYWPAP